MLNYVLINHIHVHSNIKMIQLLYGNRQQFRFRHNDINILGNSDAKLPVRQSVYKLNSSSPIHFYVEPEVDDLQSKQNSYPYEAHTPSINRLRERPGHFNIEIPINCPELKEGWNSIRIEIEDRKGNFEVLEAEFYWDSRPINLPLELNDLSQYQHIQEFGQVVDGAFDFDPEKNVIRSKPPVSDDSLLLLSSYHGSQEATYEVKFRENGRGVVFRGISDFFAGHEEQSPELGIKPGYSSAGLATIDTKGEARTWISLGDCLMGKEWTWVVKTEYPAYIDIEPYVTYCVRHQVIMADGINCCRYRIWKKGDIEPDKWLCEEHNAHIPAHLPRITKAAFGLFQYGGLPTEWSNISVRALDIDVKSLDLRKKNNLVMKKYVSQIVRINSRVRKKILKRIG